MNHWVADWAAWWETSILSATTFVLRLFHRLSLPMPVAGTHMLRKGRVWSCLCCGRHHVTEIRAHWEHQCRNVLELGNLMTQHSLMRCNLRLFCFTQSSITQGKTTSCAWHFIHLLIIYHGVGSKYWILNQLIFPESHLMTLVCVGAVMRPLVAIEVIAPVFNSPPPPLPGESCIDKRLASQTFAGLNTF